MTTLSGVDSSSTSQRSHASSWLETRLRQMGKGSLAELSADDRAAVAQEAQNHASHLYIKSILTIAVTCLIALILIPGAFILGGLALLGTLLFTHPAIFIPLLCAVGVGSIYGVKKGIEHGPALLDRWFVEPFRQARQMQEIH